MSTVRVIDNDVCKSTADFARQLRHFADLVESGRLGWEPQHMMIITYTTDGYLMRESYGVPAFSRLEGIGMLEMSKLKMMDADDE